MTDVFLERWRFPADFHQDEDISSLVVRMAAKGGMTVEQFIQSYLRGGKYGANDVAFDNRMAGRLATIAGVGQHALLANSLSDGRAPYRSRLVPKPHFRGLQIPPDFIATRKRLAPGMLAADCSRPYLRLAWRFRFLPGDPNTGEVLIHRCPGCLKDLLWREPSLWVCSKCGLDLRSAKPTYLSGQDRETTMMLADAFGLLDGSKPKPLDLPEPFGNRELLQQIEALVWLAGFRGLVDGTHLTGTGPTNAYKALQWAMDWNSALRHAVMLIFRQTAGKPSDILIDLTTRMNNIPIANVRDVVIEQVRLFAKEAEAVHQVHRWLPEAKMPPYTTFRRNAWPKGNSVQKPSNPDS